MSFGKYKGRTVRELVLDDPDYVEWIMREDFPKDTKAISGSVLSGRTATGEVFGGAFIIPPPLGAVADSSGR